MKKSIVVAAGLVFSIILTGCNSPTSSNSVDATSTISVSSPPTSTPTTSANPTTSSESDSIVTSEVTSPSSEETTSIAPSVLKTEELNFLSTSSLYGNTNGNATNKGKVVYDKATKLHYFALGTKVYSYNPASDEVATLFTLIENDQALNLTLTTSDLYFVARQTGYLMRYNFTSKLISTIYEGETTYVSRYQNYVYPIFSKLDLSENLVTGLGLYRHDTSSLYTNFSSGATNVNLAGTKIMFTTNNGPFIEVMSSTFTGKTSIKELSSQGFVEVIESLLIDEGYSSPYPRTFGLLARTSSETGVYIYSSATDTIDLVVKSPNINSLNTDGSNLYFINSRELYKYNLTSKELTKVMNLTATAHYLYVINHWLYFSDDTLTNLYRINPDTNNIETDFAL